MQIDNIKNQLNFTSLNTAKVKPGKNTAESSEVKVNDICEDSNLSRMVNDVVNSQDVDSEKVLKAKELLKSGKLTTKENIESAVRNFIEFGI